MRTCANCGKSNLPTRKYCIRCGRSLLSAKADVEVTTSSKGTVQKIEPVTKERPVTREEPPAPVDTEEAWVKPSEVSKDRIRSTSTKHQTELEKARAAFARAEEVGIDEDDTGVVVTRMLRASEVKELMEGVTEMKDATMVEEEDDDVVRGPPPISAPSPKDIEEQLLGSMSAYVEKPTAVAEEATAKPGDDAPFANDFSSSKYERPPPKEEPELTVQTPEEPIPKALELETDMSEESITTCPHCGELVNIDNFVYPREIYSAMGVARMRQARFYVVQGKYEEAQKIVRIARALFTKADDAEGLMDVSKLVDSLARRG